MRVKNKNLVALMHRVLLISLGVGVGGVIYFMFGFSFFFLRSSTPLLQVLHKAI